MKNIIDKTETTHQTYPVCKRLTLDNVNDLLKDMKDCALSDNTLANSTFPQYAIFPIAVKEVYKVRDKIDKFNITNKNKRIYRKSKSLRRLFTSLGLQS